MKITKAEAIQLRLPTVAEIADGAQDVLLVGVHTDAGITGLGEVVSASTVARAVIEAPRSAPFRHGLAAIVEGMNPLDINGVMQSMIEGTRWYGLGGVVRQSMSGIDIALWDIRGKVEGQPLRYLLNPHAVDVVDCYASALWPETPEAVAASVWTFMQEGYRAIKYGWGPMGRDAALDEALVAAARDAMGAEIRLMVDAGRVWDVEEALARAECFQAYAVSWLEEPLHPDDWVGYAKLATASPMPIATGEVYSLVEEFKRLVSEVRVPIVQPDLGRVGGITWGQRIANIANAHGARTVPHAYGTGVLLAASAQWAAAGNQPLTEYTQSPSPLARHLAHHHMELQRGQLRLSGAPGLGVELDETIVEQYRI